MVEPTRAFIFRGNAVAAGGYLTKHKGVPVNLDPKRVTVHGESSLPMIGGISHSLVQRPDLPFPEFIEYGECSTVAEGVGDAYSKSTSLLAAVRNVRVTTSPSPSDAVPKIQSVTFQASRLAISMKSTHPTEGQPKFQLLDKPDTSGMSLLLKPFEGPPVVVPLRLEYDPAFLSQNCMDDLDKVNRMPRTEHGYVVSSFVTRIFRGDQPIEGNVLVEHGLGTITFGTVITDEYSRRFSLVRLQMGSDPEGLAAFSGAESNGIWS